MTTKSFGQTLRDARTDANKTLGELARALGVSVSYVSDVELGRRAPFSPEKCEQIAALLNTTTVSDLLAAAIGTGKQMTVKISDREKSAEVGAMLMRGYEHLTDDQLGHIEKILKGRYDPPQKTTGSASE